jgi:hypothetical protein
MKNAACTTTTTTTTSSDHHVPDPQSDTQFPKLQSHSVDQRKTQPHHPKKKKTKTKKNCIPTEKDISTHKSQASDGSGTHFSLTWKENKKKSTAQLINKTKVEVPAAATVAAER